jgi:hypothetical protein
MVTKRKMPDELEKFTLDLAVKHLDSRAFRECVQPRKMRGEVRVFPSKGLVAMVAAAIEYGAEQEKKRLATQNVFGVFLSVVNKDI